MILQSQGGPPLIFDHQMAIDCEAQVIYISGGREGNDEWINAECSGLYSYDIRGNTWKVFQ